MSAHNSTKRKQRGIKQSLRTVTLPPRASRHGKPVTQRVRKVVTDETTNLVRVVYEIKPVGERDLKVAVGPTGTYGQKREEK